MSGQGAVPGGENLLGEVALRGDQLGDHLPLRHQKPFEPFRDEVGGEVVQARAGATLAREKLKLAGQIGPDL
jgi:hypothetical protein